MGYAVKVNTISKTIVIHKEICGQVERRGGAPGKYNQVHWDHFGSLKEAQAHAEKWRKEKGFPITYCHFCLREKQGEAR